jgi:hypothetical protein
MEVLAIRDGLKPSGLNQITARVDVINLSGDRDKAQSVQEANTWIGLELNIDRQRRMRQHDTKTQLNIVHEHDIQ